MRAASASSCPLCALGQAAKLFSTKIKTYTMCTHPVTLRGWRQHCLPSPQGNDRMGPIPSVALVSNPCGGCGRQHPFVWGSFVQLLPKTLQVSPEAWDVVWRLCHSSAPPRGVRSLLWPGARQALRGSGVLWLCQGALFVQAEPSRTCLLDEFARESELRVWSIPETLSSSVCAQNKGLAHNCMLLPGKSLADMEVWKTERASSAADVAGKTKLWRQFAPEGWLKCDGFLMFSQVLCTKTQNWALECKPLSHRHLCVFNTAYFLL